MNILKTTSYATILAITALISSCATAPTKTGLELQAFQKKNFTAQKSVVFSSTMSVFQDLGYIIRNADKDTGLIQAASPTKNLAFFGSHMSNTEASGFVEQLTPKKTSLRLNFVDVKESSSAYGMKSKRDKPVEDPEVYRNAFQKIQEAIFIRTNG